MCIPGKSEDMADPLVSTIRGEMALSLRSPAGPVAVVVSWLTRHPSAPFTFAVGSKLVANVHDLFQ